MVDNLNKIPPQNIEAEQSVLGALLIDKEAINKVVNLIGEQDFYKDSHGFIYTAILDLYEKHEPIDLLSLANLLTEKKQIDLIGGKSYLATLANTVPTASNIATYANIVQKKATLRRLIKAASEMSASAYNETDEVDSLLDNAEQKLFGISQKFLKQEFIPIRNVLHETFERIDELHREAGKIRGIPTGFPDLDNLLAGLQKSDLIIIAARPSVGKTSLALDIARHVATREKKNVGIFSLEMSKEQLVDRLLCAEANVSLWKMRTGRLSERQSEDDFPKIGQAMGILSEAPIYIDDSASANIMEIRTKARRLKLEFGLDLIIVDYLQLMEGRSSHGDNRVQEVAEITRSLKAIARELNIPVIALSQLARAVEQSKPAIPKLAHLRESGSIEQDADVVLFIYRKAADRNYSLESLTLEEKNKTEIHIAKHRNGPTGVVDLYFDFNSVNFKNLAKEKYNLPPTF
ncbi:MAG: replicative DNA helicase [Candidatus Komeilibacteria bacterium CG_4_10_14_0_2_um_filter_37_10]|uniref:Replicative DNA helicase n=1 Tax=Candidatus Komeilibacteria bacterium CG_4_10_14_0_2_um_filter_37_10 TaxID=1974470 RepID=A0A2M7VG00_9BACT|nr:MAG: replicative DNA helicase [Candidatus Komeilibacteria bacterium CG_4_10_14_0_2_um_filter_37_10]